MSPTVWARPIWELLILIILQYSAKEQQFNNPVGQISNLIQLAHINMTYFTSSRGSV